MDPFSTSVPGILLDIPLAALQVLMKLLPPRSHVNLRQVSQAIFKRITQRVSLQLTRDSSFKQVKQWHKLAQRLDEMTSIDVCINGQVPADVFELAMQLLSKRTTPVTELHLLAGQDSSYAGGSHPSAYLITFQPLQYLAHQLHTLKIQGIATHDMACSLQQLASTAATGGWSNLTSLSLYVLQSQFVLTNWAAYFATIQRLGSGFQFLQQLEVTVPSLELHSMATSAAPRTTHVQVLSRDVSCSTVYSASIAILAELTAAALQLKFLEKLKFTRVPDAWALMAVEESAVSEADNLIQAYVSAGLLPITLVLSTLDDFGTSLLQQRDRLRHVHINTDSCAMTWQQRDRPFGGLHLDSNSSDERSLAEIFAAKVSLTQSSTAAASCWVFDRFCYKSPVLPCQSTVAASDYGRTMSTHGLMGGFTNHLSCYSSRPDLMQHISSCKLELSYDPPDVDNLAELFAKLQSLKELEISFKLKKPRVRGGWPNMSAFDVEDAARTAAAALPSWPHVQVNVMAEPNPRFNPSYVPCFCHRRVCICWEGY